MTIDHQLLQQVADGQAGVVTMAQAAVCGVSPRMVSRRTATGEWQRVLPGVVTTGGSPDDLGRVHAAMLWAGPDAVLFGSSALWWWGLVRTAPELVSVAVPKDRPRRSRDFVEVVRHHLPSADRTTVRQIRVVGKAYAVAFASRHLDRSTSQQLLDRALLREFRLDEFHQVLDRHPGAPGATQARVLLRAAGDGTAAESERILVRLLRGAGITGWTVNRRRTVGGSSFIPDVTFERERVIIEIDGWAHHSDPERFGRDRLRQNSFGIAGWTVLRFTWAHLTQQPDLVLRTIKQALGIW